MSGASSIFLLSKKQSLQNRKEAAHGRLQFEARFIIPNCKLLCMMAMCNPWQATNGS
jgi:hypothetical protein